jgi:hypothetical protein
LVDAPASGSDEVLCAAATGPKTNPGQMRQTRVSEDIAVFFFGIIEARAFFSFGLLLVPDMPNQRTIIHSVSAGYWSARRTQESIVNIKALPVIDDCIHLTIARCTLQRHKEKDGMARNK